MPALIRSRTLEPKIPALSEVSLRMGSILSKAIEAVQKRDERISETFRDARTSSVSLKLVAISVIAMILRMLVLSALTVLRLMQATVNFCNAKIFNPKSKFQDEEDTSTESTDDSSSTYESHPSISHADTKQHTKKSGSKSSSAAKASSYEISPGLKLGSKIFTETEIDGIKQIQAKIDNLPSSEREGLCADWLSRIHPCEIGAYLRSTKKCSVEEAWKNILHSAQWRKSYGVANILQENSTTLEGFFAGGTREVDWLPKGSLLDGSGNPCLLYRSAAHVPLGRPTDEWLRFFVHLCEWARRKHPTKQVVILVDRVGSGLSNQDPTVLRELVPVIQNHYPQLVGRVCIAPVNKVLWIIWRIVSLILDEEIKEVIELIEGDDWQEQLCMHFKPAALPVRLGGENNIL